MNDLKNHWLNAIQEKEDVAYFRANLFRPLKFPEYRRVYYIDIDDTVKQDIFINKMRELLNRGKTC